MALLRVRKRYRVIRGQINLQTYKTEAIEGTEYLADIRLETN